MKKQLDYDGNYKDNSNNYDDCFYYIKMVRMMMKMTMVVLRHPKAGINYGKAAVGSN